MRNLRLLEREICEARARDRRLSPRWPHTVYQYIIRDTRLGRLWLSGARLADVRVSYIEPSPLYDRMPCLNSQLHMATCMARSKSFAAISYRRVLHADESTALASRVSESTEGSCSHSFTSAARAPPLDRATRGRACASNRPRLQLTIMQHRRTRHDVQELAGNHSGI